MLLQVVLRGLEGEVQTHCGTMEAHMACGHSGRASRKGDSVLLAELGDEPLVEFITRPEEEFEAAAAASAPGEASCKVVSGDAVVRLLF